MWPGDRQRVRPRLDRGGPLERTAARGPADLPAGFPRIVLTVGSTDATDLSRYSSPARARRSIRAREQIPWQHLTDPATYRRRTGRASRRRRWRRRPDGSGLARPGIEKTQLFDLIGARPGTWHPPGSTGEPASASSTSPPPPSAPCPRSTRWSRTTMWITSRLTGSSSRGAPLTAPGRRRAFDRASPAGGSRRRLPLLGSGREVTAAVKPTADLSVAAWAVEREAS